MTLLIKDTEPKPDAPAGETPAEAQPQAAACRTCQAPIEPGQDWCLNCGEAQPSRRVSLPGKRAAATVLALTTVLVGGAVAASYAALTDGSEAPATPTQVAQVPQPAPAPPAPSTAVPSDTAPPSTSVPETPKSTTPPAGGGSSTPPVDSTPVTPTPTDSGTGSTGSGSTGTSGSQTTTSGTDTTADTRTKTSTTPTETAPVKIDLADGAATLYDPFKRDSAASDPSKALDGDPNTSFAITVAPGSQQIGAGLALDLGKKQGVRELDLTTKTPGFKIELYATDETDLPPDVLDTRWAHLKDVTGVGAGSDGKETVTVGAGTSKYRHVLLWITAPPTDGSTVRIGEVKLLG